MAHPPSTSKDQARRLCEILKEQQEPFSLEVYLCEKGYPTNFLDIKTTTTCWPGNEKHKLLNGPKNKTRRDGGALKGMVSKILHGKCTNKPLNQEGITSVSDRFCETEKQFEQFSPVSVLELRSSCESSPVSIQSEEEKGPKILTLDPQIMNIFKELLEAAYTSEFDKFSQPIYQNEHQKSLNSNYVRNIIWETEKKKGTIKREKKKVDSLELHRVELERLSKLICKEISETPKWRAFDSQIREIAIEIEDALFDEIIVDLCRYNL